MAISQYILTPREEYLSNVLIRNKWMVRIRWYYIGVLTLVASLSTLAAGNDDDLVGQYLLLGICGLTANGLMWAALQKQSKDAGYYKVIAILQVLVDIALASFIVYLQGGLASRGTILFALPILISGILFFGLFAFLAAIFSSIGYALSLVSYQLGHPSSYAIHQLIVPAIFYSCVFMLIAAIVVRFSNINAVNVRESSYSQLLAMLKHQLRHPASTILALLDGFKNLPESEKLTNGQLQILGHIQKEDEQLSSMVENLLAAADPRINLKNKDVSKINLGSLLEEIAKGRALATGRQQDLELSLPANKIVCNAEAHQIRMALNNIIDNSFRYSRPGTPVRVSLNLKNRKREIIIEDSGRGISKANQRQLFHRFTNFEEDSTEESPAVKLYSSGLGLFVSKLIVERHGGSLNLKSRPGRGTKITMTL